MGTVASEETRRPLYSEVPRFVRVVAERKFRHASRDRAVMEGILLSDASFLMQENTI